MPEPFALTEAMIHDLADPEVFARGRGYLQQGAVTSLARSEDRISAQVQGSAVEPYRVQVKIGPSGIEEALCTCPYVGEGACKHLVAALLVCLEHPEAVEESSSLEARLSRWSAEELQAMLLELAGEDEKIEQRIERRSLARETKARPPDPSAPPLDPAPYRRQARAAIRAVRRGGYGEPMGASDVSEGLFDVLEPVESLVAAGDGRNALILLEAVTDEFVGSLDHLYDREGDCGYLIERLDGWWAEALLSANLSPDEGQAFARKLREWHQEIASKEYYDQGLQMAAAAAEQGWDYSPLVRVLQGEITQQGAWEGEAPHYADELAVARLNVLERQGRFQEYLYLAEAESQTERFLAMLVRVGRVAEAVEEGRRCFTQPQELLGLAKALHAHGDHEQALQMAEHGLDLKPPSGVRGGRVGVAEPALLEDEIDEAEDEEAEDEEEPAAHATVFVEENYAWTHHRAELARWLRDTAVSLGQPQRALPAARIAMEERPSLDDYQALQAVAGQQWPELRAAVLERLRTPNYSTQSAAVEIFLHERLPDEAIAVLESGHPGHEIVGRVVAAVRNERPEWAMNACFHQAERIIEPARAQYYDAAAEWLAKAREVAVIGGLLGQWERRMDDIMTRHQRKYKLMPLLEALR